MKKIFLFLLSLSFALNINSCSQESSSSMGNAMMGMLTPTNVINSATAISSAKQGNYKDALYGFNNIIAEYPNDYVAIFNRGVTFYKDAQYSKAASDFKTVSEIKPNYTEAIYALALSQQQMGQVEQAKENIELAKSQNPYITAANALQFVTN